MNNWISYVSTPIISAFIGWITTYLAIKMIFRPRKPIRILAGFAIQGLIPRRQADLARSIAEVVEKELVSHRDVHAALTSSDIQDDFMATIEKHIDVFLKEKLGSNPMIAMFMQGDMLDMVRTNLSLQLRSAMPEVIERVLSRVESRLNFQDIVRSRVESFDLFKLEDIIYGIASRELRAIEYLCGLLGFVIGLFQVGIAVLSQ